MMKSSLTPASIARQIAVSEAEIAASNQRLRKLRGDLQASAKHAIHTHRVSLIVGGMAVVAVGALMYPRKRALMARARWMMRNTAVRAVMTAVVPMAATFMAKFMAHEPTNKPAHPDSTAP